jgi:uncharacterized membrane protein HdeD (DUF308 family)
MGNSIYSTNKLTGKGVKSMYLITGILGIALGVAPFIFGYTNNVSALWTSILIGGIVLAVSVFESRHKEDTWEYWIAAIFGLTAIFAPFVLGFSAHVTATWISVLTGMLITIFAGSRVYKNRMGRI